MKLFISCKFFAILSMSLILLTGCLIPEKFDATISIAKDGSYKFRYDGTLAYALALEAVNKNTLAAKDEEGLKKLTEEFKKDKQFTKVEYLGKARYQVVVEKEGKPNEPYYFLSKDSKLISIIPQKDGTIAISAVKLDSKSIATLKAIGSKIEGTLSVTLGNGVKVISQNATTEPSFFGLMGAYKWQIKSSDVLPSMVVKIK